jgi:hypothetical protein
MTPERANAYCRALGLIAGPGMDETEQEQVRHAADTLLFAKRCDESTHEALCETRAVLHGVIHAARWSQYRADRLLGELRACGPDGLPVWAPVGGARHTAIPPDWLRLRP